MIHLSNWPKGAIMDNNIGSLDSQYYDNKSIWIINPVGKLKRVFAPFKVLAIKNSQDDKKRYYIVDEVRSTATDELVYLINGKPYLYSHFTIDIRL